MIRDTIRAALVVAVMAAAAAILVEARHQLAALDIAHRAATAGYAGPPQVYAAPAHAPAPPGPLRRFGRAAIDMADAAIGVIR